MNKTYYPVERIKALSITEVVRRAGGTVRRSGRHHITLCPWHDDHHPSLTLYDETGRSHCYCHACGRTGDAISYVMQTQGWTFKEACEWICQNWGIPYDAPGSHATRRTKLPKPVPVPIAPTVFAVIPEGYMRSTLSSHNSFCECMRQLFPAALVEQLAEDYCLGTVSDEDDDSMDVIFWSIDRHGTVRNGKQQRYATDPTAPEFFHTQPLAGGMVKKRAEWIGKRLVRKGLIPIPAGMAKDKVEFKNDCLFGEHLLARYPRQSVALVESPKNALLGAAAMPEYLWLAVGNKTALKPEVLEPLRGRNVLVMPDRDAIDDWAAKLDGMQSLAYFSVSNFAARMAPAEATKYDVADYIIDRVMKSREVL